MSAAELIILAIWTFAVALAGGLTGLVLGNLRLPLVLLIASSPAVGAGSNLAISAIAAATAAATHIKIRENAINWRLFCWMAPPSAVGAFLGGYFSSKAPGRVLLIVIAIILLISAIQLLRRPHEIRRASLKGTASFKKINVMGMGFFVGLIGGVVGLILGSIRMPALLRFTSVSTFQLVATNLLIGLVVGIVGTLSHFPNASPELSIILVGAGASIPGAILGARLTGRLSEVQLIRAIGIILVLVAIATAVQAAVY